MKDLERCTSTLNIRGVIFKCDLNRRHTGQCVSLAEPPNKIATVMWNKQIEE